ncbi:MAG: GGDEF domain-containing protein [Desulfovibrionaceae bacterium]|nr:GGDEF domain-containing protein [Desulfovibrionaceae bacterium]
MKVSTLIKTNLFVVLVLALGFFLLSAVYYHSFYNNLKDRFKHKASESLILLYDSVNTYFTQPSYISRTMATNNFLIDFLSAEHKRDESFDRHITSYLKRYSDIYHFDGAFLVVTPDAWFYTQEGFVSNISQDVQRHDWYQRSCANPFDYDINIDIDKTPSSQNEESIFFNHKILDEKRNLLGFTGLCVHLNHIQDIFSEYFKNSSNLSWIINEQGLVQVSSSTSGLAEINFFELYGNESVKDCVNAVYENWRLTGNTQETFILEERHTCLAIRYMPDLAWYLLLEINMEDFYGSLKQDIVKTAAIILSIMLLITVFISRLIFGFEKKVIAMQNDQQRYFYDATRCMYFSIYEINVSQDMFTTDSRNQQFRLSPVKDRVLPYSECLQGTVEVAVKKEYQGSFFEIFKRENVIKAFHAGKRILDYDCPVLFDEDYEWLHFNAHLFLKGDDNSIFMYLYVKNINKEIEDQKKSQLDALTQCLLRRQTEESIESILSKKPSGYYAFFIVDIDRLKTLNDTYGHVFGDYCIRTFGMAIKGAFRNNDIIGRIGGDEFVVFVPSISRHWLEERTKHLSAALCQKCTKDGASTTISGSIGVSVYPKHGSDFSTLYASADKALYETKTRGRNGYTFYKAPSQSPS